MNIVITVIVFVLLCSNLFAQTEISIGDKVGDKYVTLVETKTEMEIAQEKYILNETITDHDKYCVEQYTKCSNATNVEKERLQTLESIKK